MTTSPTPDPKVMDDLLRRVADLAARLERREQEFARLSRITEHINFGVMLEEVLEFVYRELQEVIPYDRIGFSLVDEARGVAVARWARSTRPVEIAQGYEAPLAGSSLQEILRTGQVRILNDLEEYLRKNPNSESTRRIVQEGVRSSLTCPLVVQGKPVGFLFFSSMRPNAYSAVHVDFFRQIAGQLSAIVEKGRLYSALARQNELIETQNRALTEQMDMARKVQQALIPARAPVVKGLEIAFEYLPAIQVGGDVLDIIELHDDRVFFFVGDAMGHGVAAALVMGVVKTALRTAVSAQPDPGTVLGSINRTLANLFGFNFVTAAAMLMDASSRKVGLSLAGHGPPFWYRAASHDVLPCGDPELPLGVEAVSRYRTTTLQLEPEDALVFYTDGIFEATDREGKQYGLDRLKRQVQQCGNARAEDLLAGIRRDLDDHRAGRAVDDDLTLLVVKCLKSS